MGTPDWSRGVHIAYRALADLPSSRLYLLAIPNLSEQLKLPVHDFIAHSPGDPLRKINNLAAVQFTTLFHGYTWVAGIALPEFLQFWNRWSIAVHFALALVGVSAVRDYDAVVISRSECDFTKVAATEQKSARLN